MQSFYITHADHTDYFGRAFKTTDATLSGQKPDAIISGQEIIHDPDVIGDVELWCDQSFLQGYIEPTIAAFIFPAIEWDQNTPLTDYLLWECETLGETYYDQLLINSKKLLAIKQIDLLQPSLFQRQFFAVACSISIYHDTEFLFWANNWISGTDRTAKSIDKIEKLIDESLQRHPGLAVARCTIDGIKNKSPLQCAAAGWRFWSNCGKSPVPMARLAIQKTS